MPGLHCAIVDERLHQIRAFLAVGMRVNIKDEEGRTPLMVACFMKNLKRRDIVCQQLLEHGADVDVVDKFRRTVLMYACATRNDFLLDRLLEYTDSDLNQTDKDGNTCLMYAAIEGDVYVLQKILQPITGYGLSLDVVNKRGFTAYLLALKNGNVECARLLQENGASARIFDMQNYWNGEQWLESHYSKRFCRETLGATETSSKKSLLRRPKSMPPLVDQQKRGRSSSNFIRGDAVKHRPHTATMNFDALCFRKDSSNRHIPPPSKRFSERSLLSRISKSTKRATGKENIDDSASDYQDDVIGDYDTIVRPQTGYSFRTETLSMAGRSEYFERVSTSGKIRPQSRGQKEQLIKIFEQYSINQVPIPPAIPKIDSIVERKKVGRDQTRRMSVSSDRPRQRRLSTVRAKVKDVRAEVRTITAMKPLQHVVEE
ncbi:uncharacterized protein LOC135694525 [Rhopilema esculentum]|uniref:uncharacterized protein LOC135694525 n=1 Tax=Rhopilema esculentum TaxID=499914 RepID=UPI0031D9DF1E